MLVIRAGRGRGTGVHLGGDTSDTVSHRPRDTASASPSEDTTSPESRPTRYQLDPAEVDARAKRTAARAVEALPKVERVTYTQYFGYLPPLASILVEADFEAGGGTTSTCRSVRATAGGASTR